MTDIKNTKNTAIATTTTTTSATIPMFNVVDKVTLTTMDEEIEFNHEINFLKDLKRFLERSEIRYLNSIVCVKIGKKTVTNIEPSNLLKALTINIEYEWSDQNCRYLILDKDNFSKIESEYHNRLTNLHLPKFQIEDGRTIFGYEIIDEKNIRQYELFGTKISKTLSLFFSDVNNVYRDRFVVRPLCCINESTKEKYIEIYNELDFHNEQIIRQTILRAIEESFEDEDEDDWI